MSEALEKMAQAKVWNKTLTALPSVVMFIAEQAQAERVVELAALVNRYPFIANSVLWQDIFGKPVAALARTLPPETASAANQRGLQRDLWATVAELAAEFGSQRLITTETQNHRGHRENLFFKINRFSLCLCASVVTLRTL